MHVYAPAGVKWPGCGPLSGLRGLLVNGYRKVFFPGVKQTEREGGRSPPSSTDVNSKWSYASVPLICLHGVCRDAFTFVLNTDGSSIQKKTGVGYNQVCAAHTAERSYYP
jgi:hypothetical protein